MKYNQTYACKIDKWYDRKEDASRVVLIDNENEKMCGTSCIIVCSCIRRYLLSFTIVRTCNGLKKNPRSSGKTIPMDSDPGRNNPQSYPLSAHTFIPIHRPWPSLNSCSPQTPNTRGLIYSSQVVWSGPWPTRTPTRFPQSAFTRGSSLVRNVSPSDAKTLDDLNSSALAPTLAQLFGSRILFWTNLHRFDTPEPVFNLN